MADVRLGVVGFGGPAAHVALMQREFVEQQSRISERRFLDAVNAAAVALMIVVTRSLGQAAMADWRVWLIGVVALVLLVTTKINTVWLILIGALAGRVLAA